MLLLLTGLSSPLISFAETLIAAVARSAGRIAPDIRLHDPTVEDPAITEAVQASALPVVMVIGDPLSCLAMLVDAGHSPLVATRALTAAAAPLVAWKQRNVIRLRADMTVGKATEGILGLIGVAASGGHHGNWQSFSLAEIAAPVTDPAAVHAPAVQALTEQVVAPLFEAAATGVSRTVIWSRATLFWGDHPDETLPRIIDLTGPARVLAYGPYFHLPAGHWSVCATLAFSPAAVGAPFAIELHGRALLGRGRFKAARPGVFAAYLPVEVQSPHVALEIRVVSEAGAIEGEIGVDHVQLIPS